MTDRAVEKPKPARRYSDQLVRRAAEMRERGMSCGKIAKELGMSVGAVNWHCLRLGAEHPNAVVNSQRPMGPEVMQRSGHVVRRFTDADDQRMIELATAGYGASYIAREIGRKHSSVIGRLMTLARNDARREAAI